MKTNEAPERIYIHPTLDNLYGICERSCDNEIEYVRKDSFIEKACEWLNNFYNDETRSYLIAEDIEKFINYMKGE